MKIKFQSNRWVTLMGRQPKKWQKWMHRNTYLRVGRHAFNLTTAPHLEYHKISYSHSVQVRTSAGHEWVNKKSKMWF